MEVLLESFDAGGAAKLASARMQEEEDHLPPITMVVTFHHGAMEVEVVVVEAMAGEVGSSNDWMKHHGRKV